MKRGTNMDFPPSSGSCLWGKIYKKKKNYISHGEKNYGQLNMSWNPNDKKIKIK